MVKKARPVKIRRSWSIDPKTRVKKSKKLYSRKNKKKDLKDEFKTWSS
ncbi:MAG: hypothetical protein ABIG92_07145 [Candidatus Omnitrophota bacterium]